MSDAGFQVDARLYAMAIGYTLGSKGSAAAVTPDRNKKRNHKLGNLGNVGIVGVGCALVAVVLGAVVACSMCPGKGLGRRGDR